jgi:hypothetical protein
VIVVDPCLDRTWDSARALVGERIQSIQIVRSGRNSRVYRVETAGWTYALKEYPSRDDDPRDRLGTEAAALELMERHGIERVPRMLAVDPQRRAALLSWLHGTAVTAVEETDIDAAAAFLAALHALRATGEFAPDHFASEACMSGAEIVLQIKTRLARLRMLPAAETQLQAFLDRTFAPAFGKIMSRINALSAETGINVNATLPSGSHSLVPSDFGFHNSLRADDGSLVFLDFEYFGWDDPVKVTADFMLHPGTPLAASLRWRFRVAAERLYGEDPWFRRRLTAYYPLFALRWVLILLNDFIPNRWRSEFAGATESWESVKQQQLSKAQQLLARVVSEHDGKGHGE